MSRAAAIALCAVTLAGCGGSQTFANPVYNGNFPDPFVLKDGDTYYAYATNGDGKQVQTATSSDLAHWTLGPDALPQVAEKWGYNGATWAPEVMKIGKTFVLYYTSSQKIGRAVATT